MKKTEEAGNYAQSKALHDIVNWSTDRPDWQREVLSQSLEMDGRVARV